MAKINDTAAYPVTVPVGTDLVIGTDKSNTTNSVDGETVNFTISAILGVSHTHSIANVTGLQAALDAKAAAGAVVPKTGGAFTGDVFLESIAANFVVDDTGGNAATGNVNARITLDGGGVEAGVIGFINTTSGQMSIQNKLPGDMRFRAEAGQSIRYDIGTITALEVADGALSIEGNDPNLSINDLTGDFATNTANSKFQFKANGATAGEFGFINTTSGQLNFINRLAGDMRFRVENNEDIRFETNDIIRLKVDEQGADIATGSLFTINGAQHTHTIANVTGLQAALDAKASLTGAETLTNKTLTAPAINTSVSGTALATQAEAEAAAASNKIMTPLQTKQYIDHRFTISTAAPSGGEDGDVWYEV